jgi:hypothetical protein
LWGLAQRAVDIVGEIQGNGGHVLTLIMSLICLLTRFSHR